MPLLTNPVSRGVRCLLPFVQYFLVSFRLALVVSSGLRYAIARSRPATAYTNLPPAPYVLSYQLGVDTGATTSSRPMQQGTRRPPKMLAPIPIAYTETEAGGNNPPQTTRAPYPRSYDPNARCDCHGGAIGHATERCWGLKHKVQDLLDGGLLGFQD
ncbi:hypothetical protein CR513_56254, partial [Mucuna pruriens]